MKRLIFVILVCAIFALSVSAETLGDLKTRLRYRLDEVDVSKAFFADSSLTHWLNMSQEGVVRLGGFIPKTAKFAIGTDRVFAMPTSFRGISEIFVVSSDDSQPPYPIAENPGFLLETIGMQYSVIWINPDSANLILKMGALENPEDTIYVEYLSTANVLTSDASTVDVPADLIHLIIKEATGYYYEALHMRGHAQAIWQEVRMDMGLLQQRTGSQ